MPTLDPSRLAQMILEAPAWARLGITAPKQDLRQRAAEELARAIAERMDAGTEVHDGRQMGLPLDELLPD